VFTTKLKDKIKLLKEENLYRQPKVFDKSEGIYLYHNHRKLINFSSNDYIGLAESELVKSIFAENVLRYGSSSSSSRLVSANWKQVNQVEQKFANYFGFEDCLFFSSGFQANLGLFSTLFSEHDTIAYDKHVHASVVSGIQASNAKAIGFNHNNISHFRRRIESHKNVSVLAVESLYSMDGDFIDQDLFNISKENNIFTIVDEAHSLGAFGDNGKGINKGDIVIGTLGKAFGLFGAFVLLPTAVKDFLMNKCRGIIYTTMLPEAVIVTAGEILDIIEKSDERRNKLTQNADYLKVMLKEQNIKFGGDSYIVPIMIGDEKKATSISDNLFNNGYHVLASRYPTVPRKKAILRVSLTADHSKENIDSFVRVLAELV
jgi:8-amino-7-oxononanoate synthase